MPFEIYGLIFSSCDVCCNNRTTILQKNDVWKIKGRLMFINMVFVGMTRK